MANDALNGFTSLLESIPGWMLELEDILKKTAAAKQDDIILASQPLQPHRKPSKSSSLQSRRSKDDGPNIAAPARPTLMHLTNSDVLRLSRKKRKTVSVVSGDISGPCKFRNQAVAVVYYDGDTQKQFEKLVRNIGSSRNTIRKDKMAAKVDSLARSGSTSSESSGGEDGDYSKVTLKHKTSRPRLPTFGRPDDVAAFDRVDSKLEKAQSLCERAAHQILRDGDCTLELTNAKEHFSEALTVATAEIPVLQKKAERAAERQRREDERQRLEDEVAARRRKTTPAVDNGPGETIRDTAVSTTFPGEGTLEVDELEVDDASGDEDDDHGDFNISSFHIGKLSQIRSARLAAH